VANSEAAVRAAGPRDVAAIVAPHTRSRTEYHRDGGLGDAEIDGPESLDRRRAGWARAVGSGATTVLGAIRDGALVGVASMARAKDADDVGDLLQIHVAAEARREGVCGTLHAAFVRYLRDNALTAGRLEVWERNDRARGCYAHHGWRPDGHHAPAPAATRFIRLRLDPSGHPNRTQLNAQHPARRSGAQ
jgi:ribosomal protein S18 acetylase RimI-like enzyme